MKEIILPLHEGEHAALCEYAARLRCTPAELLWLALDNKMSSMNGPEDYHYYLADLRERFDQNVLSDWADEHRALEHQIREV